MKPGILAKTVRRPGSPVNRVEPTILSQRIDEKTVLMPPVIITGMIRSVTRLDFLGVGTVDFHPANGEARCQAACSRDEI